MPFWVGWWIVFVSGAQTRSCSTCDLLFSSTIFWFSLRAIGTQFSGKHEAAGKFRSTGVKLPSLHAIWQTYSIFRMCWISFIMILLSKTTFLPVPILECFHVFIPYWVNSKSWKDVMPSNILFFNLNLAMFSTFPCRTIFHWRKSKSKQDLKWLLSHLLPL